MRKPLSSTGTRSPRRRTDNDAMLGAPYSEGGLSRRRVANPGRGARCATAARSIRSPSIGRRTIAVSKRRNALRSPGRRRGLFDANRLAALRLAEGRASQRKPPRRRQRRGNFVERTSSAPQRTERPFRIRASGYSAGVADTASTGIVIGSASRRKRRHAIRISRNSRTHALGSLKCDANSRFCSMGTQ